MRCVAAWLNHLTHPARHSTLKRSYVNYRRCAFRRFTSPAPDADSISCKPVTWFDYELAEKAFYKKIICDVQPVSITVEKLVQPPLPLAPDDIMRQTPEIIRYE